MKTVEAYLTRELVKRDEEIARLDSLFAREKLGSTGLGQGIAIPHGRISKLRDATAAFSN